MIVTAFFLKGNIVTITTLSGTKENHTVIASKFNTFELTKNPTQKDVADYVKKITTHCEQNNVKKIILNRRVTAGQMAGGSGTFINEGILLALSPVPVEFVHAATVRATDRKDASLKVHRPEAILPGKSYDFAFEGLK